MDSSSQLTIAYDSYVILRNNLATVLSIKTISRPLGSYLL